MGTFLAENTGINKEVLNNIREAIIHLDVNGIILYVNSAWERITGFSIVETIGKNIFLFVNKLDLTGIHSTLYSNSIHAEFYLDTKEFKTKVIDFSLNPLFSANRTLRGYVATCVDMTERKLVENQIRASQLYSDTLNRELQVQLSEERDKNHFKDHLLLQQSRLAVMGSLAANMGRQWKQPLTNLTLLIQTLRDCLDEGEVDPSILDSFTRDSQLQVNQLMTSLNDLRAFFRASRKNTDFSMPDALERALSLFSHNIKSHNIRVHFEYRLQHLVHGNVCDFCQTVLSLLAYARDAFVINSVSNRYINIEIKEKDDFLIASFIISSVGLPDCDIDRVFEPNASVFHQKTGLCLYVSKMLMHRMGGEIELASVNGNAKFTLSVPKSHPVSLSND